MAFFNKFRINVPDPVNPAKRTTAVVGQDGVAKTADGTIVEAINPTTGELINGAMLPVENLNTPFGSTDNNVTR